MSGKLGKCPTCKKEVSTSVKSCPHCGEVDFEEKVEDQNGIVVEQCYNCTGRGTEWDEDSMNPFRTQKVCHVCRDTGYLKKVPVYIVDTRTGKKRSHYPDAQTSAPRPESAGCASIILLDLTLVSAFLFAVLL